MLRANYTKPLESAYPRSVMSTEMSPLQDEKQLRLQAAGQRRLMDGVDVRNAAYEVGYES